MPATLEGKAVFSQSYQALPSFRPSRAMKFLFVEHATCDVFAPSPLLAKACRLTSDHPLIVALPHGKDILTFDPRNPPLGADPCGPDPRKARSADHPFGHPSQAKVSKPRLRNPDPISKKAGTYCMKPGAALASSASVQITENTAQVYSPLRYLMEHGRWSTEQLAMRSNAQGISIAS